MKKNVLFVLLCIITTNLFAQISYQKGYFIDNSNQKTECLIKNLDWKNNPETFLYKLTEAEKAKEASIQNIKEFGVYSKNKYIKVTVDIDMSRTHLEDLTKNRNPEMEKQTLFLKVLIEGKANLYYFEKGSAKRYFFNKENEKIEQLVYRQYLAANNKTIKENNYYKQQILINLQCEKVSESLVKGLSYKEKDLTKFFSTYNSCFNNISEIKTVESTGRKNYYLAIRPRFNINSLTTNLVEDELKSFMTFGLGIEGEFILPFNNDKWSIFAEPTYTSTFSDKELADDNSTAINFSYLELSVGVRYYFFLSDESKLLLNAGIAINLITSESSSTILTDDIGRTVTRQIENANNLILGLGYELNEKFNIELRYSNRDVFQAYNSLTSDLNTFSVILGYNLF